MQKKSHTTFVDNVIVFFGYYLPVEIKLSIYVEKNLKKQCEQYCNLDKLILEKDKKCDISKLISNKVLIIDTEGIYMYCSDSDIIEKIFSLDDLQEIGQIGIVKRRIKDNLGLITSEIF